MKTFYTVRDIEDMHAAGVSEIKTHDDVVLTDVAREKAIALGMRLVAVGTESGSSRGRSSSAGSPPAQPTAATPRSPTAVNSTDAEVIRRIKAAVIARLGTDAYNDLLDRIIPQVMSRLKK